MPPDRTLAVRPVTRSDAEAIAALYRPYVEQTSGNFEYEPPDAAEVAGRIASHPGHPWLVALAAPADPADDTLAGFAYVQPLRSRAAYQWTVETSVYAAAPGRGVGGLLMRALFDACVVGGWRQAFAGSALPNEASVALHERLGFVRVGTFSRGRVQTPMLGRRRLVAPRARRHRSLGTTAAG
ncbi:GNAT family N-acetyltransferase [soil metagenome]